MLKLSRQIISDRIDPTRYKSFNQLGNPFIGVGGRSFQKRTYQSVYLTAAVTDLGGYMDVYGGYGLWEQFGAWRF